MSNPKPDSKSKPDFKLNDRVLEGGEVELFEVMVMRDSSLVGQSLKIVGFRQTYDLTVLAVNRHSETIFRKTQHDAPEIRRRSARAGQARRKSSRLSPKAR